MDSVVNVFVSTFPGLSLPPTVNLPISTSLSCRDLSAAIADLLPVTALPHVVVTTQDNRRLSCSTRDTLADLLSTISRRDDVGSTFLSLRLSVPLRGGKGGFGSQLRAAGGRMSSRKRKQNAELATGSARNLDGRRLRTITEAKNLATYLATKPDMDRKEKEERRKRWEQVIELADQREADMRAGKTADGRRKGLSEEWIQEKEDVGDNVKNAVKIAMAAEAESDTRRSHNSGGGGSETSPSDSAADDSDDEEPMQLDEDDMARLRVEAETGDADAIWVLRNRIKIPSAYLPKEKSSVPRFAGFDDDLSSDSDEDTEIRDDKKRDKEVVEITTLATATD